MRADLNADGVRGSKVAQHSSASNEHYTPPAIVEACRSAMGAIDLDPCSCELAQEVVKAEYYYSHSALFLGWGDPEAHEPARVFLNPPGGLIDPRTLQPAKPGTRGAKSSLAVYWAKLWNEWQIGNVSEACFVCFNLEVLRTTQDPELGSAPCLDFPIVYLRERPKYWNASTPVDKRGQHGAPSHPGAVVYMPRSDCWRSGGGRARGYDLRTFSPSFSALGHCVIPA